MPAIYVTSSLFYTAADVGIIPNKTTTEVEVTPQVGGWVGAEEGRGSPGAHGPPAQAACWPRVPALAADGTFPCQSARQCTSPAAAFLLIPPPPPTRCPQAYARAAAAVCGKQPAEVMKLYPAIQADQAPYLCMDLTMIHALLTRGFNIGEKSPILVVKEVRADARV